MQANKSQKSNNDNDELEKEIKEDKTELEEKPKEEKENLLEKCHEMENKYKRALADYHNLMKQTAQEKMEVVRYANESMLYQILPVYDNLKVSLSHINDEIKQSSWLVGIQHVIRQFRDVLNQLGVEEIETKGKKFDHQIMDAIDKEITTDKKLDNHVAREVNSGYRLKGKVISPAKVVVYEYKKE